MDPKQDFSQRADENEQMHPAQSTQLPVFYRSHRITGLIILLYGLTCVAFAVLTSVFGPLSISGLIISLVVSAILFLVKGGQMIAFSNRGLKHLQNTTRVDDEVKHVQGYLASEISLLHHLRIPVGILLCLGIILLVLQCFGTAWDALLGLSLVLVIQCAVIYVLILILGYKYQITAHELDRGSNSE